MRYGYIQIQTPHPCTRWNEFLEENNIETINFENDNKNFGETLLKLAVKKYYNDECTSWENLKPLYIQPPPIHQKKISNK